MKRSSIVVAVLALSLGAVWAQNDPIATRKATMKKVGGASADVAKISKGETPFDLKTVQAALQTMGDAAKIMPTLFPETSKTGGDTAALPKIWEDRADFDARWASFKVAYADVSKNCGGCHETYRARKN